MAGWPPDNEARSTRAPSPKITTGLPVGTQARFIAAADVAADLGTPINHLLSVHWSKLFAFSAQAPCLKMGEVARVVYLVELLRKWVTRRVGAFAYIWVREINAGNGQHWHLALLLANQDRIDRGRHVVVDAAGAGAAEECERAVVGIEHHLPHVSRG